MYKSLIHETGQGTFRLEIRDGNNELVYSTERGTHDRARQDQLRFLIAGPNTGTRKTRKKRIEQQEGEETGDINVQERRYAATVETIDSEYNGHDDTNGSDGDVFA